MPFLIVFLCLLLFVLILVFRAMRLMAKPIPPVKRSDLGIVLPKEKIVMAMQAMLRCPTVSNKEHALENERAFEDFIAVLAEHFPRVHAACSLKRIGRRGLLYHWPSAASGSEPWVFMSHYDVVPVDEKGWTRDPFGGEIIEGELWGRGSLDTKGTLLGIMAAAEALLESGFSPARDCYFAFSGEEEIFGSSANDIVSYFQSQGITPGLVLDEGGAVVERPLPGVSRDAAVIGIAEKGIVNLQLRILKAGGHASTPARFTAATKLAKAILKLEKKGFPCHLSYPVEQMLVALAKDGSFLLRLIAANLFLFKPLLFLLAKKTGGELSAMLRTTIAITQLQGSSALNVMPTELVCGMNLRILPGETKASCLAYIKALVNDPEIEVSLIGDADFGSEPSRISTLDSEGWARLSSCIHETWPQTTVAPYLMMAGSDSRHWGRLSDRVYRFSAMKLSKAERALIHSNDERVPLETLYRCAEFYVRMFKSGR